MLIHGPDLIESIFIALFESLELILQFFELLGELLIILSELDIRLLILLALSVKLLLHSAEDISRPPVLIL